MRWSPDSKRGCVAVEGGSLIVKNGKCGGLVRGNDGVFGRKQEEETGEWKLSEFEDILLNCWYFQNYKELFEKKIEKIKSKV